MRLALGARALQRRRLVGKLSAYAATSAALATAEASASIVYTDLGPGGIAIRSDVFDVDLDQDGVPEFHLLQEVIHEVDSTTVSGCTCTITRRDRWSAIIEGRGQSTVLADAQGISMNLAANLAIDPGASGAVARPLLAQYGHFFRTTASNNSIDRYYTTGNFVAQTPSSQFIPVHGYLGLQFEIDGSGRHAAWAEVEASPYEIILHSFAYETMPGQSIAAGAVPEPPSLVLLAAGAAGMAALRRKRLIREQF